MDKNHSPQVFQTNNPSRWQRFKWGGRFLLFVLILVIALFAIAIKNMYLPDLPTMQGQAMKQVLQQEKPTSQLAKNTKDLENLLITVGQRVRDVVRKIAYSIFQTTPCLAIAWAYAQLSMLLGMRNRFFFEKEYQQNESGDTRVVISRSKRRFGLYQY